MAARLILVPADSELLRDPNTEVLHRYANGESLIRSEAPTPETGREEMPVQQGVRLAEVSDETLQKARASFTGSTAKSTRGKAGKKKPAVSGESMAASEAAIPILAFVEFIGPVDTNWLELLKTHGIELLRYQPENSYLCRALPSAFQSAASEKCVLGITPLTDELKRQAAMPESGTEQVWIVAYGSAETLPTLANAFRALPDVEIDETHPVEQVNFCVRIPAVVSAEGQSALLRRPEVIAIEPFAQATAEDEVADLILANQFDAAGIPTGSYLRWLEDRGVNGKGVTIGIVDGGVEIAHPAFKGRIRDLAGGAKSWHGTFVAGHAAGCYLDEKDSRKFIYGLGVAPAAELLAQDKSDVTTMPAKICLQTVTEAGPSGAGGFVQNNSWGAGTRNPMDYGSLEAAYDGLVRNSAPAGSAAKPLTICFSSGNSGSSGLTRPKAAKNILVTGNSENYRPEIGGADSDNINEVYTGSHASSHGNCGDGRIRPHVVAPGEWTASANYDSHPGQREFVSPQITWGGGSSGASPKTAGACALLIQWWKKNNNGKLPSPAMLRALIVNGATEMNVGGPIPNKFQGWGRLNVATILANNAVRIYEDQATVFTQRSQKKEWRIRVADPTKPVRITLAWTDPPGPIGSGTASVSAVVNKLALRVEANGKLYRGNHFRNGWAEPDPTPNKEGWDNLQNVYLPPGVATGSLQVTVSALELTTNCLTGKPENPQQDFAIVITNGKPDGSAIPTDVGVIVDSTPPGQNKPKREMPNSADFDWWSNLTPPVGNNGVAGPVVIYGDSPSAEEWWKDDFDWSKSESTSAESEVGRAEGSAISAALADGLNLIRQLAANRDALAEESSDRADVAKDVSAILAKPFDVALADLADSWQAADQTGSEIARKRAAVVVVSAGTHIGQKEVETLRSLNFMGQLYLVSDHAATLAYLAQGIHHQTGIEFRLAANADDLGQLIVATLAEAGSAQRVCLTGSQSDDQLAITHRFSVIEADRRLTILVSFADEAAHSLWLKAPGEEPFEPGARASGEGMEIQRSDGKWRITLDRSLTGSWVGQWQLLIKRRFADAAFPQISIWAKSSLQLMLQHRDVLTGVRDETTRDSVDALVALSGQDGVSFSSMRITPRAISEKSLPAEENEREIEVTIKPSRLDSPIVAPVDKPEGESSGQPGAVSSMVSARLPVPQPQNSAAILDLPINVVGVDSNGHSFHRETRSNLIQLLPPSTVRSRPDSEPPLIFTQSEISQALYKGKTIVGLRLKRGSQARNVVVADPQLQEFLARTDLTAKHMHFCAAGRSLLGIIRITKK